MLYCQRTGSGKTIVFIHGSSQSSKTWGTLMKERPLDTYTLISIDLPGHGQSFRSVDPEKDYTLKGMAAHLKDFLMSLNEEYIIVANSIASNLIAEVIIQLPQCKGLFLIGASVIGKDFTVSEIVKPNPYFGTTFTADPSNEELKDFINTLALQTEGSLNIYMQMFRDTDPALRIQLGTSIAQGDWSDEVTSLEQLEYPVAVVYGADEKIISPDYLTRSAISMWRNGIIKIPAAGHYPQLDQPAQLAKLISQYAADIFRSAGS